MHNRKQKTVFARIFSHQITFTILGFFILLAISFPLAKNISQQYRVNKEIKELEAEILNLEKNHGDLQKLVKYLESEQFVLEQARLNLNLKKEGEKVVVIKEKGADNNSLVPGGENSKKYFMSPGDLGDDIASNNVQRWWNYFFKLTVKEFE